MKPDGSIAASAGKNQPVQLLNDGLPAADVAVMNLSTAANYPPVKAGVGVCYDGCFQRFAQRMVSRGAQFLVFPTMNVELWGITQHLQHQRLFQMRAAETGRTVLVAAVSGPTFAAAPNGTPGQRAAFHKTSAVLAKIQEPHTTLFNLGGWLIGPACLVLTLSGALWLIVSRILGTPSCTRHES
jgi:apolipoprotein N-acyltransferase